MLSPKMTAETSKGTDNITRLAVNELVVNFSSKILWAFVTSLQNFPSNFSMANCQKGKNAHNEPPPFPPILGQLVHRSTPTKVNSYTVFDIKH